MLRAPTWSWLDFVKLCQDIPPLGHLLDRRIQQGLFPGHVVAPGETVRSVANQGEFEPLDVCEVHVLCVGVVAVLNRAVMEHGGGDLLLHRLQENSMHGIHGFAVGAHNVCLERVQ